MVLHKQPSQSALRTKRCLDVPPSTVHLPPRFCSTRSASLRAEALHLSNSGHVGCLHACCAVGLLGVPTRGGSTPTRAACSAYRPSLRRSLRFFFFFLQQVCQSRELLFSFFFHPPFFCLIQGLVLFAKSHTHPSSNNLILTTITYSAIPQVAGRLFYS
jgi:hypothetical protein